MKHRTDLHGIEGYERGQYQCFCCDRVLDKYAYHVWEDGQLNWVGPTCFKKVNAAGSEGFQPKLGGPRLYSMAFRTGPCPNPKACDCDDCN